MSAFPNNINQNSDAFRVIKNPLYPMGLPEGFSAPTNQISDLSYIDELALSLPKGAIDDLFLRNKLLSILDAEAVQGAAQSLCRDYLLHGTSALHSPEDSQQVLRFLTELQHPARALKCGLSFEHLELLHTAAKGIEQLESLPQLSQIPNVGESIRDSLIDEAGFSDAELTFRRRAQLVDANASELVSLTNGLFQMGILYVGMSTSETAATVLAYVQDHFSYIQDGADDHWNTIAETLKQKGGDCEDLAMLTSSLLMQVLKHQGFSDDAVHHMVTVSSGYIATDEGPTKIGHTIVRFKDPSGETLALDATSKNKPLLFSDIPFDEVLRFNDKKFVQLQTIDPFFETAAQVNFRINLAEGTTFAASDSQINEAQKSILYSINKSAERLQEHASLKIKIPRLRHGNLYQAMSVEGYKPIIPQTILPNGDFTAQRANMPGATFGFLELLQSDFIPRTVDATKIYYDTLVDALYLKDSKQAMVNAGYSNTSGVYKTFNVITGKYNSLTGSEFTALPPDAVVYRSLLAYQEIGSGLGHISPSTFRRDLANVDSDGHAIDPTSNFIGGPDEFFNIRKVRVEINSAVDSFDMYTIQIKEERFFHYIEDIRQFVNKLTGLFLISASYLELLQIAAREIGDQSLNDEEKQAANARRQDEDKQHNKFAEIIGKWQDKMGQGVRDIEHELNNFIRATNESEAARVGFLVDMYPRKIDEAGKEDAGTIVANVFTGIGTDLTDEFTGAFTQAKSTAKFNLSIVQTSLSAFNAQAGLSITERISKHIDLWDAEHGHAETEEAITGNINNPLYFGRSTYDVQYGSSSFQALSKRTSRNAIIENIQFVKNTDLAEILGIIEDKNNFSPAAAGAAGAIELNLGANRTEIQQNAGAGPSRLFNEAPNVKNDAGAGADPVIPNLVTDAPTNNEPNVSMLAKVNNLKIKMETIQSQITNAATLNPPLTQTQIAVLQSDLLAADAKLDDTMGITKQRQAIVDTTKRLNAITADPTLPPGPNFYAPAIKYASIAEETADLTKILNGTPGVQPSLQKKLDDMLVSKAKHSVPPSEIQAADLLTKENLDKVNAQVSGQSPDIPAAAGGSERYFFDYNMPRQATMRRDLIQYQNFMRAALIAKQNLTGKIKEEAAKLGDSQGSGSETILRRYASQALEADLSIQYGAFDNAMQETFQLGSLLNELATHQLEYYRATQMAAMKATKFALQLVVEATSMAAGNALSPLSTLAFADPFYFSYLFNTVATQAVDTLGAGWEMGIDKATAEYYRPTIMQLSDTEFNTAYTNQKLNSQSIKTFDQATLDSKKTLDLFSQDSFQFFEHATDSLLLHTQNLFNPVVTRSFTKDGGTASGNTYKDTVPIFIQDRHDGFYVTDGYEMYLREGPSRTSKDLSIPRSEAATNFEQPLWSYFAKIKMYMFVLYALYDAVETILGDMFGTQKSSNIQKFDGMIDSFVGYQRSLIGNFKQETSAFLQSTKQNAEKEKKIEFDIYDVASAGTKIAVAALSAFPNAGRVLVMSGNILADAAEMIRKRAAGTFAGTFAEYRDRSGSTKPAAPIVLNASLFPEYTTLDPIKEKAVIDLEVLQTIVTGFNEATLSDPLGDYTRYNPTKLKLPDPSKAPASEREAIAQDARRYLSWFELDQMESKVINEMYLKNQNDPYHPTALQYTTANFTDIIAAQTSLNNIFTIRTIYMMIEQGLLNAKQQTIKDMFGHSISSNILSKTMAIVDQYNQSQLDSINSLTQEFSSRAEAHNKYEEEVMGLEVDSAAIPIGAVAFWIVTPTPNPTGGGGSKYANWEKKIVAGKSGKQAAQSLGNLTIGLVGIISGLEKKINPIKSEFLNYEVATQQDKDRDANIKEKTDEKDKLEKKQKSGTPLTDDEKKTLSKLKNDTGPGSLASMQTAKIRSTQKRQESDSTNINMGQDQLKFVGSGQMVVQRGAKNEATSKLTRKARQAEMIQQVRLSLADAFMDSSDEMSGSKSSRSYRGVIGIINRTKGVESSQIDLMEQALEAKANESNRAMNKIVSAAVSMIAQGIEALAAKKVAKAKSGDAREKRSLKVEKNKKNIKHLEKKQADKKAQGKKLSKSDAKDLKLLQTRTKKLEAKQEKSNAKAEAKEKKSGPKPVTKADKLRNHWLGARNEFKGGSKWAKVLHTIGRVAGGVGHMLYRLLTLPIYLINKAFTVIAKVLAWKEARNNKAAAKTMKKKEDKQDKKIKAKEDKVKELSNKLNDAQEKKESGGLVVHLSDKEKASINAEISTLQTDISSMSASMQSMKMTRISLETPKVSKEQSDEGSNPNVTEIQRNAKARDQMRSKRQWRVTGHMSQILANIIADGIISASTGSNMGLAGQANLAKITDGIDGDNVLAGNDGDMGIKDTADLENATLGMQLEKANSQASTEVMRIQNRFDQAAARALRQHALDPLIKASLGMSRKQQEATIEQKKHELTDMIIRIQRRKQKGSDSNPTPVTRDDIIKEMGWKGAVAAGIMTGGIKYANAVSRFMFGNGKTYATIDTDLKDKASAKGDKSVESKLDEKINELEKMTSRTKEQDTTLVEYKNHKKLIEDVRTFEGKIRQSAEEKVKLAGQLRESGEDSSAVSNLVLSADEEKALPEMKIKLDAMNKDRKKEFGIEDASVSGWSKLGAYAKRTGFMNLLGFNVQIQSGKSVLANSKNDKQFQFAVQQLFLERRILESKIAYDEARSTDATYADQLLGQRRMRLQDAENVLTVGANLERMTEDLKGNAILEPVQKSFQELQDVTDRVLKLGTFTESDLASAMGTQDTEAVSKLFKSLVDSGYAEKAMATILVPDGVDANGNPKFSEKQVPAIMMTAKYYSRMSRHSDKNSDGTLVDPVDRLIKNAGFTDTKTAKTLLTQFSGSTEALDSIYRARNDMETAAATLMSGMTLSTTQVSTFQKALKTLSPVDLEKKLPSFIMTQGTDGVLTPVELGKTTDLSNHVPIMVVNGDPGNEELSVLWVTSSTSATEAALLEKLPKGTRLFKAETDKALLPDPNFEGSKAAEYDTAVSNVVDAMSSSNQVSVDNVAALTKLTTFLNNFTNTTATAGHAPAGSAAQAIGRSQGFNKALRAVNLATRTSMDARDDISRRLLNSGVEEDDIKAILEDLYKDELINKTTGQATNLTPDNIKAAVSKRKGDTVKAILQQSLTDQYQQRTIKDDIERRGGKTQAEYQSFLNLLDTSISLADTTYNAGGATPNTNEQNALTALKTVISAYGQKASDTANDQKRFVMGVRTSNAQVFSYDDVKFDVFGSFGKGLTGAALERLDVVAPQNRRNLAIGRAQEELGINPARAVRSLRELYKEDYIRNEAGEILYNTDMAAMANKPSAANPPVLRFNVQKAFFEDVEKAASRIHGHMNTEGGAQIAAQIVMATIDNFSQAGKEYMEEETRNFLPHLLRIFQNEAPEDAEKLIAALIAQNQNNPRGLATVMDGISRAGQTDVQFFKGLVDQNKAQRFALSVLQLNLGGQTASMGLNPTEEAAMMMEQRGIDVNKNAADFRQAIIKSENIVDIFAHTTAADLQQGGFAAIIKNDQDFVTVEEKLKAVASDKMAPDGKRFLANQALRNIYAARDKSPNTNDIDLFSGDTTLSPKEFGAIGQSGLFSKPLYGNKGVNENLEELANKLRDPKTRTQTVAALNASGGAGIRDLSILLSQANNSDVGAVRHESAGQKGFVAATAILDNLIDINSADSEAVLFKLAPVLAGPLRSSLPTQTVSKYLDQPNSQRTTDPDALIALDLTTRFKNDQASSQQFLNGVTTSNKEGVRSATPAFINELDNADDEKLRKFAALVAKSLATQSTTTGANGQDTLVGDELLATVAIPVLTEEQNKKFAGYLGEEVEKFNKHLTDGNKIDIDERINKLAARTAHEHKDKADQFRDSLNHGMLSRRPQFLLGKDLKTGLADEAKKLANKPDSSADVAALNTFNRDMVLHGDRQAAAALITELLTVTTPEAKQHANAAKRLTRSVGQLTLNPTERQRASLEAYYTDVMKTTKGLIDNPDTADTIKEIHQHAQDQLRLLSAQAPTAPGKDTVATRLAGDIRTNLFKLDSAGNADPSKAAKSMVSNSFQARDRGRDTFSKITTSSTAAPNSPQQNALEAVKNFRDNILDDSTIRPETMLQHLNTSVVGSINTLTEGVDALGNPADRQWMRTVGDLALLSHEKDIDEFAKKTGSEGAHARALQGPLKEAKARVMKTYLLNATADQINTFSKDPKRVQMLADMLPDIVLSREEKTMLNPTGSRETLTDKTQTSLDKDGVAILTKLLSSGTDYEATRPLMPKILDLLDTPMGNADRTSLEPLVEKRLTQQLSTLSNTDTAALNETAQQLLQFQNHQGGDALEPTQELKETLVKLLPPGNSAIQYIKDATSYKELNRILKTVTDPSLDKIKGHLATLETKETAFKQDQTLGEKLKAGEAIADHSDAINEMMKDPKRMEAFKKSHGPQYLEILTSMPRKQLQKLSDSQIDSSTTVLAHPDLSLLLNGTNKDILAGYMNGDLSLFLAATPKEQAVMLPLLNLDPGKFSTLMENVESKTLPPADLKALQDGKILNKQGFIHPEFLLPDGNGLNPVGAAAVSDLLPTNSASIIQELNAAASGVESREKLVDTLQKEVRNSSNISSQEMQSSLQTLQKIKSKLQNRTQDAFGQLADMANTAQKQAMDKDVQPYHETVAKMAGTLQNMQPELLKLGVSQDAIDKLKSNDPDTLQFEILDILKTARANAGGGEQIQLDKITQQLSTAVFAYALDPKVQERTAVKENLQKFLGTLSKDAKNPIAILLKNSDSPELLDGILTLCKGKDNEAMLAAVLPLCFTDATIKIDPDKTKPVDAKTLQLMSLLQSNQEAGKDAGIAILNTLSPDKQVDILNLLYSGTNPNGSARDIAALLPKTTGPDNSPIALSKLPFSDLHEEGLARLLPVLNKMALATAKNIIPQLKIMTDPNLEPYANQMSLLLSSELQTPAGLRRITELEVTSKLMKKATTNPAQFQTDLADKILKTPIESDFSSTFSMLMSDQASQQQIISLMNANPAVRDRLVSFVTSDQSGTMISSRTLNSMMQSTQFKAAVTKNIGSNKDVSGERADLLYHALRLSSAKGIRQKESMTFESSPDKGKATIGKMMQLSLQDGKTSDLRNFFLRDTATKNMVLDHIADGLAGTPGAILSKQQAMKALNVLYTPEMAVGALEKGFKAQYALATNPQEKNAAIDSFLKETLQNPDFLSSLPPAQRNNMMGQVMRSVTAWVGKNDAGIKATLDGLANVANDPNHTAPEHVREQAKEITLQFKDETEKAQFSNAEQTLEIEYANATDATEKNAAIDKFLKASQAFLASASPDNVNDRIDHVFDNISDLTKEPSLKIAVINSFIQQTILDKDFLKNMPDDNRNKLIEKVLNNITTLLEDPHAAKTMLTYLSTQTNAAPHVATHAKSLLQSGAAAPTASTLLADLQNTPEFKTKWASDPAYRETMLKEMTEGLKASPPDPMILALASPGIDGTRPLDSLLNDTYPSPKERAARQRFLDKLYEAKTKDPSFKIKEKAEFAMWIGKHQPAGSISATQFVDSKKGLTLEQSQDIHTTLKDNGFLDASGRVTRMLDSTTVSEIKALFSTSLSPDQIQGVLSTLTTASSGSPASQTSFLVNDLLPKFDPSYKAHKKGYTKQLTAACQSVMDSKDLSDQQKLEWLKVLSKQGNEKHETAALKALHTYTNKMASTAVTKEEKAAAAAQKAIFTELLAFSITSQPSVYLTQANNQISPMGQLLKTIVENDLNDPANPGSVVFGLTSALQKTPYPMFVIDTALEYVYLSKSTFTDKREHYRSVFKTMLRKAAVENNVGVMNALHVMGSHLAYQGQSVTFLHEVLSETNTFTQGELLGISDLSPVKKGESTASLQARAKDDAARATKASDFLLKRLSAHDNGFLTYDKASKTYIRTAKELTSPDELKLDDFFRNKDFFPTPPTQADRTRILNSMVNELSAGPRLISSMVSAAKSEPDYQLIRSHKESMPDAANALDPKKALPSAKDPQSYRQELHSINNYLLSQGPAGAALKTVMDARVMAESPKIGHDIGKSLTTDLLSTPVSQISSELMAGTAVLRDSDFTSTGTLEKLISTGYIDSKTGRVTEKFMTLEPPHDKGPLPGLEGEFLGQHQAIRDKLTQAAGRQAEGSQRSQEILKALIPANAEKLYKSIHTLAPDSQLYRQLAVTGHALVKELASQADALAAEKNNATDPVKLRHIASQEETLKSHLETLYIGAPSMFMGALKTTGSSEASARTLMGMKGAGSITQTFDAAKTAAARVKTVDPAAKRPDNPILEAFKPIANHNSPKEFALALRATDSLPETKIQQVPVPGKPTPPDKTLMDNFKAALGKQQKQDGLASKSEAFIRYFGFQDADRQEVADALRILEFTSPDMTGKEHPESMAKDIQTLHETLPVFAGEGTVTVNKGAMQHAMGLTGEDGVADRVFNALKDTGMITMSGNTVEIPSKPFTKAQWDALNAHLKSKDPLNTLQLSDKKTDFLLSDAKKAFESRQENLDSTKILSAVQTLYVDEKGNLTKAKLKKDFPVFETNPDKLETLKFELAIHGLESSNKDVQAAAVQSLVTKNEHKGFREQMVERDKTQPELKLREKLETAMKSTTGLARKDITTLEPKATDEPTHVNAAFAKFDEQPNPTLSDLKALVIGLQT